MLGVSKPVVAYLLCGRREAGRHRRKGDEGRISREVSIAKEIAHQMFALLVQPSTLAISEPWGLQAMQATMRSRPCVSRKFRAIDGSM